MSRERRERDRAHELRPRRPNSLLFSPRLPCRRGEILLPKRAIARAKHTCRKLFSSPREYSSRAPRNRFIPCFTASRAPRARQTARPISHHTLKKPLTRFFRITKLAHEKGGD